MAEHINNPSNQKDNELEYEEVKEEIKFSLDDAKKLRKEINEKIEEYTEIDHEFFVRRLEEHDRTPHLDDYPWGEEIIRLKTASEQIETSIEAFRELKKELKYKPLSFEDLNNHEKYEIASSLLKEVQSTVDEVCLK